MRPLASSRSSGSMDRSSQIWVAICSSFAPGLRSHAYSACNARARARVSTLVRDIEPVEEVCHLERRHRGFVALVAHVPAGARFSLGVVVRGQDAEADGDIELRARGGEPARTLARDVLEMRC